MNGRLVVVDDVASEFARQVEKAFATRKDRAFSMALTGGDTAQRCYERLALGAADSIDWWSVDLYWSDERCEPPDREGPNHQTVREALLEAVGAANTVHPMRCEEGAESYQLLLGELGRLDLVHLDLGADGAVAGLLPGSPALDADPGRLVVVAADPTSESVERMTLTYSAIRRARLALVTVEGAATRQALKGLLGGEDHPAARLAAEELLWIVDAAALPR